MDETLEIKIEHYKDSERFLGKNHPRPLNCLKKG